jgi:hypothetical protein
MNMGRRERGLRTAQEEDVTMHKTRRLAEARRRWPVPALALLFAGTAAGCGGPDFTDPETCALTLTCGDPCSEHPGAGPPDDICGVFLSDEHGEDTNDGTMKKPVKTFMHAIALATRKRKRIYACHETFVESVGLPAGIDIWGGLDCDDGLWSYDRDDRTTLAPVGEGVPLAVVLPQSEQQLAPRSLLLNLVPDATQAYLSNGSSVAMLVKAKAGAKLLHSTLRAGNGALPGGSSIGLLAQAEAKAEVEDSRIETGNGAEGESGNEATGGTWAKNGLSGFSGLPACSKDVVTGGTAVWNVCDDYRAFGGEGGESLESFGGDGLDGEPIPIPNPYDFGVGGGGETDAVQCRDGTRGRNGTDGVFGRGAAGRGTLTSEGWVGVRGEDGTDGVTGYGGGGGGGSRGGAVYCGSGSALGGASGGSGGAPGCGGKGGKGGGPGGSSIGIVASGAVVSFVDVTVSVGNAGNGGAGGQRQTGGIGGHGGRGGTGVNGSAPGCDGGNGGKGGNGGWGGGGSGGHALGIALRSAPQISLPGGLTVDGPLGTPGQGGPSGQPDIDESKGESGLQEPFLGF